MAAKGYPNAYQKGSRIVRVEDAAALPATQIFHAATARRDGQLVADGGRVLDVTALGKTVAEAQERAYAAVDTIDWPDGFCRRDSVGGHSRGKRAERACAACVIHPKLTRLQNRPRENAHDRGGN